ncbi:MAG: hypothetical protein E6X66_02435 [Streptococcus salivarius]|uniref:hypothetical protein n=1 Tax=Streptococcus salivarius TaxID=1304 RepID=UPI002000DA1E|nr:hypothetical protein [Streptococcus salivarius]MDU4837650.1 hypothetical protein [Streptococcus salivarius]
MTGITQGLYYIEKVDQYNINIGGFPSDLINNRISAIIDSNKVDIQQSLRRRPVRNVVLNREGVSNLPPIEIPFESSLYYAVEEINPGLSKLIVNKEHAAAFQEADIRMLETRLTMLQRAKECGNFTTSNFPSRFPQEVRDDLSQLDLLAWGTKDMPTYLFCLMESAVDSYLGFYSLRDLMEDANGTLQQGYDKAVYWLYSGVKGQYEY